jgi:hypothetical protein
MRTLFLSLAILLACERASAGLPLGKPSGHHHQAGPWDKDPIVEDLKNVPALAEMRRYGITYDDQVARTKALLAILERHDLSAFACIHVIRARFINGSANRGEGDHRDGARDGVG